MSKSVLMLSMITEEEDVTNTLVEYLSTDCISLMNLLIEILGRLSFRYRA